MTDESGSTRPVALVVGIGPGLGRSIARQLASDGFDLVLVARTADRQTDLAAECAAAGAEVLLRPADITLSGDRHGIDSAVRERFGRLDVMVNNAYTIGPHADAADADLDAWRAVMEVNLWAPLALLQLLHPLLRAAGGGSVVLISAMTTRLVSSRGRAGYAMSKAAVNQAVRSLAYEWAQDRIRVNAVLPGWMDNESLQEWQADPERAPAAAQALAAIPLGSFPTPDEVAGSVSFLVSGRALPMTGQLLDPNGGQFMA